MPILKECIIAIKYPNITPFPPNIGDKHSYIHPKLFEKHLLWLLDWKYHPVSPFEMLGFLFNDQELNYKSFMIVFESGYKGVIEHALPILKRYRISALTFLVVNHIGDVDRWDKGTNQLLSIDDIQKLQNESEMCFGLQTKTNRDLTKLKEEEVIDEIIKGKCLLEEVVREDLIYFNYPHGKYNKDVAQIVSQSGLLLGFINKYQSITNLKDFTMVPSIQLSQKDNYLSLLRKIRKVEAS